MSTKITKFPDGQINVELNSSDGVITHRINSYEDLAVLLSISECMRFNFITKKKLIIPWMFGQRSDRRFAMNESFGLKVITDQINSCKFHNVELFDPHSDVSLALINNSYKNVDKWEVTMKAIMDYSSLSLVSPDAGAYKKLYEFASKHKYNIVAANKFRDINGKISINFNSDVSDKHCLIADDICEYGGTFKALATELKSNGAKSVSLYVSHFSGGGPSNIRNTINGLLQYIDTIYTTNSVMSKKDFSNCASDLFSQIKVFEVF